MHLPFITTTTTQESSPAALSVEKPAAQGDWTSAHGAEAETRGDDPDFAAILRQLGERELPLATAPIPAPSTAATAADEAKEAPERWLRRAPLSAQPGDGAMPPGAMVTLPLPVQVVVSRGEGKGSVVRPAGAAPRGSAPLSADLGFAVPGRRVDALSLSPPREAQSQSVTAINTSAQRLAEMQGASSAVATGAQRQAIAPLVAEAKLPDRDRSAAVAASAKAVIADQFMVAYRVPGATSAPLDGAKAGRGSGMPTVARLQEHSIPRQERHAPVSGLGGETKTDTVKPSGIHTQASPALTGRGDRGQSAGKARPETSEFRDAARENRPLFPAAHASEDPSVAAVKTGANLLAAGRIIGLEQLRQPMEPALPQVAGVSPADVLDQIVQKSVLSLKQGVSEMRIDLKPESLGQLQLKIVSEHQQLRVTIVTEQAEVKEILESGLAALRHALLNQGLQVDRIDVSVLWSADSGPRGEQERRGGSQPQRHPAGAQTPSPAEQSAVAGGVRAAPWNASGSSLVGVFA